MGEAGNRAAIVLILGLSPWLAGCGSSANGTPLGAGFDRPEAAAVAVVTAPVRVPVMMAEEGQAKRRAAARQSKPVDCRLKPGGGIVGKDCPAKTP